MGTGDFICISMTGGAPWGFRLQGGKEQKQPLQVAKIRSQSKASGSGLCEGDEVVSINGNPCTDLTYPEVIKLMESIVDSLQMLVKRKVVGALFLFLEDPSHLPCLHRFGNTSLLTLSNQPTGWRKPTRDQLLGKLQQGPLSAWWMMRSDPGASRNPLWPMWFLQLEGKCFQGLQKTGMRERPMLPKPRPTQAHLKG
ncbi:synaptopodin-2 isoform X3 [Dipodomys spectabilis]|uniref:synaptopodin-2 isoform X3 n=1 Tax=Dipodomys spectabilis TaxID=105255 RepID=UPI001C5347F7|nr:synaptopodin-2 isoform X3 [Dipodomys spectabilis]